MISSFIDDPEVFAFVAVSDDRAVGFGMFQLLDGGNTAMFRAGRVHKDFRGTGVVNALFDYTIEHSKQIRPAIQRMTVSIGDHVKKPFFGTSGVTEVMRKRDYVFSYKREVIHPFIENLRNRLSKLKELTVTDIECLFHNKRLIEELLPNGFFYNNYVVYRPVKSNIKHLINNNSSVFATTRENKLTTGRPNDMIEAKFDNVSDERNLPAAMLTQIDMISCSQSLRSLAGHAYTCGIYCRSDDVTSLRAHIEHHVTRMAEVTPDDGVLVVTFPDCLKDDDVVPLLAQYGITELVKVPEIDTVIYESENFQPYNSKL